MKSKKSILIVLALMIAACLSVAALAEEPTEIAADTAQAESTALTEALEAYSKAKAESRKLEVLTSLKEELDGYVADGALTQEQADLILKYYAEQLTLMQQNGTGFGRGGRGGHGGKGFGKDRMDDSFSGSGLNGRNGFGGRQGRFSTTVPAQQQAPAAPADQDTSGI